MKTFYSISVLAAVILIGVGLLYFIHPTEPKDIVGVTVPLSGNAIDIIGTKSGTSTLGMYFGKNAANAPKLPAGQYGTSTYPMYINDANSLVFTFNVTAASATQAYATFNVLGSHDLGCDTASSTTIYGSTITKSQINWFDASPYIVNLAGSSTLGATSTVFNLNPVNTPQSVLALTNINFKCLMLKFSASSTALHVQAAIK